MNQDSDDRPYPRLEDCDLSLRLSKDEEAKRLGKAQRRLLHLRLINGGQLNNGILGPPVCIVFEGWDAAGKGGAIKRLVEPLDPRHVHVAPFAAPTPDELRHHFLWRFWPPLPGWGGMTIFDRSWYGRVLVERVENFATEVQWRRAYQEIADFEHSLAEEGLVVIKLWMHMSDGEQLRRFERRRDDPLKAWKLTAEDWRNREKRAQYDDAVSDMLRLTHGPLAPWDVISSESKRNGRVEVIETVIRHMEAGMERWGVPVPRSDDEEKTELALSFDDAEFQQDPASVGSNGAFSTGAMGRLLRMGRPARRSTSSRVNRAPGMPPARPGITIPFDGIPLHAHREWFARLRELGYTDLWSAEVDGSDGFTPLALAAAWEPELNLGVAITPAYTRGPALLAQSLASMADAAPGRFFCGLGASSQVIVADWNGLAFENQYRRIRDTLRFLRMAFSGEKVTEEFETFKVKGFRLARVPEQLPPVYLAALRPGMLHLAGREADGAILNWLSAEDVATSVAEVEKAAGGAPREIVARIFVIVTEDAAVARTIGRRMITAYLNVHAYAEFHRWLGRGPALQPMWDAWAAGDRKGALAAIPDEVVDDLVVHGSVAECRAHIQRYVDNGITVPAPAVIPIGIDLADAVAGLSPSAK